MKKIALGVAGIFGLFAGAANAARLDVSRLTLQDEFSATFGAYYNTGMTDSGDSQTDFGAGRIDELGLGVAYTPTENLTLSFGVGTNNYSDSQVGMQYKLFKSAPFKLDFLANYGIAWTKSAGTDDRFGNNNAAAGFRIHGVAWENFQWAFSAMGQYIWADPSNFWNVNLTAQAMYYFCPDIAATLQFDFNFLEIEEPKTLYDKTISAGIVYNLSSVSSINPFIEYHFHTQDYQNSYVSYYNYWQIGITLSTEF